MSGAVFGEFAFGSADWCVGVDFVAEEWADSSEHVDAPVCGEFFAAKFVGGEQFAF